MFEQLFSEHGLSLDRLHTLQEVAEAGSIAAAARGDATRQSQYSRQLKELEQFFGITLTRRQGRVLTLTPAGQELLQIVNASFCALDDFKCRASATMYRYMLGCGDSIHAWMVAPVLGQAVQEGQPWQFSFANLRNADVSRQLLDMELDLGILRTSAISSDVLESVPVARVKYALYVPVHLQRAGLSFAQAVTTLPIATLGSGSFYTHLQEVLQAEGLKMANMNATQSFPFALRLLRTGGYAAFLPDIAEVELPGDVLKLESPALDSLSRKLSMAWNPRLLRVRPAAEEVIRFFIKHLSWR